MMMFGNGWFGPLWMVSGVLLILGVILVVIWAVQRGSSGGDDAMRILRERFARGEIDAAQFEEQRRVVGSAGYGGAGNRIGWIGLLLIVAAVVLWIVGAALAPGPNWYWGLQGSFRL